MCGNHVSADATIEGDTYAGGTDTTAIRLQLKVGAERLWTTSALDIKAAFLNADLHTEEEPEDVPRFETWIEMPAPRLPVVLLTHHNLFGPQPSGFRDKGTLALVG